MHESGFFIDVRITARHQQVHSVVPEDSYSYVLNSAAVKMTVPATLAIRKVASLDPAGELGAEDCSTLTLWLGIMDRQSQTVYRPKVHH